MPRHDGDPERPAPRERFVILSGAVMPYRKKTRLSKSVCAIFALLLFLFFRGIGDHGLLDPVEGVNASVALNMAARGDFAASILEGASHLGKSLGYWWLSALSLLVFGWSEFAVRFWAAFGGLGMAAASWFIARRTMDGRAAGYAAVLAGTNLLTFAASQLAAPYTFYAFCVAAGLAGIVYAFQDRRFFFLFHAFSSLGLIVCGPAAFLLPWLAFLIYAYLCEQEHFLARALLYWPGLAATFLIAGGYLLSLYLENPAFLASMRGLPRGVFGFLPWGLLFLIAGFFPWIGILPCAVASAWPRDWSRVLPSQKQDVLLMVWAAVFLVFGLLSGDAFLLTASVPPLASLCAGRLRAAEEEEYRLPRSALYLSGASMLAGLAWLGGSRGELLRIAAMSVLPWACLSVLLLVVWYRASPLKLGRRLCAMAMFSLLPLAGAFDLLAESLSMREAGIFLRKELEREDVVLQYAMNRPSLFFYTGKDSFLTHLSAASPANGEARSEEDKRLINIWTGPRRVFMLVDRRRELSTSLRREVFSYYENHNMLVLGNRRPGQNRSEEGR
ncbi:MAG: glycosyltransferase family 39 protein [Synergistaceae bacterium]|nr:glycosyltransferase family 39 protein [Synergistaceae bacterium]